MKIRVMETNLRVLDPTEYSRFMNLSEREKENYVDQNWQKYQVHPRADDLQRMNTALHPLLKDATDRGLTDQIANELTSGMGRKMDNLMQFHQLMSRLAAAVPDRTPIETIQLHLPSYLMLFEGVFTTEINLISFLLAMSGKEFRQKKHGSLVPVPISNYRQIQSRRMRDKFSFVAAEGFEFVIDAADYDLRNAIAHTEYELTTEGALRYVLQGRGLASLSLQEMDSKLETLLQHAECFRRSALEFYVSYVKSVLPMYPEPVRNEIEKKLGFYIDKSDKT
jgi:hypothetical protein